MACLRFCLFKGARKEFGIREGRAISPLSAGGRRDGIEERGLRIEGGGRNWKSG